MLARAWPRPTARRGHALPRLTRLCHAAVPRGRATRRVRAGALPPRCELVTDVERVAVRLKRPLGLVLGERAGGEGVFVESLVAGGNAERSRGVLVGDVLVAVDGADVSELRFDDVMDALAAGAPAPAALELERSVTVEVDSDAASGAATYWAAKRAANAAAPTKARNTVPGLASHKDIRLRGSQLGGGSFGAVFEAEWAGTALVVKRANERVVGAAESLEAELALNERVAACAPGACAAFLGCVDVPAKEAGELYNKRLSSGLWLVFAFESRDTLAAALARRDADAHIGAALRAPRGAPRTALVRSAGKALLGALAALHTAGVVHRDVKPSNCVLVAEAATLRLIDLGAGASCLQAPVINYAPGVGACDPLYCEGGDAAKALPQDAPPPADDGSNLASLWRTYRPDAMDVFAAGLVLLQLAVPSLRPEAALRALRSSLAECDGDLLAWRDARGAAMSRAFVAEAAALDAACWSALALLLAPRAQRVSAAAALELPFFT